MLDANVQSQLKAYMEKVTRPFEIVASLDDSEKSRELQELLREVAELSERISLREDGDYQRRPSFALRRDDADIELRFAGLPMGHEFTSLILALLQTGGHPPRISEELAEQIRAVEGDFRFETFYSQSCQNCPEVVQALNMMAVLNPAIQHVAIDGAAFKEEVEEREIMSVPTVFLNGEEFGQGRMGVEEILQRIDTRAGERQAQKLNAKDPFDVLIVGGGPAGASSAVYAARKGIRTGLAAERFGGQVLDTNAIENFISVTETQGPELAARLEEHVRQYDVDIMNLQRASQLIPAAGEGGLHEVRFENGASLRARTVILSTGARWKPLNVPGEDEYRNRGVAYCPHCDGPLFKGKPVAVIGGGNSGVEAAIDLAGIVRHVTLIEFADELKADDILQRKLESMSNTTVITSGQTTEITGDGSRVTGLVYRDRNTGDVHELSLDGVFIQIGLLPNTEWLDGTVELSPFKEIVIDSRGATSVPGVFAAGDVTTVPYKQIVIAMGEGSTAALSAFDYLIRHDWDDNEETAAEHDHEEVALAAD